MPPVISLMKTLHACSWTSHSTRITPNSDMEVHQSTTLACTLEAHILTVETKPSPRQQRKPLPFRKKAFRLKIAQQLPSSLGRQ